MYVSRLAVVFVLLGACRGSCQPPPPPPPACASITIPPITGPGSGTNTLCVAPTDCREDTMAGFIASTFCSENNTDVCPDGNASCSTSCIGIVSGSALAIAAGACTWDRNSECLTPAGTKGGNCTCVWTLPAASTLQCGCGCK